MERGLVSLMKAEKMTDIMCGIIKASETKAQQVECMAPAALAYMGDVLFEMFVRDHLLHQPQTNLNRLHRKAITYVNASAQAWMVKQLSTMLTEEEQDAVRRGRNGKTGAVPRNADVIDYRYATGFEALLGWLYYQHETARLVQVMTIAVELLETARKEENSVHEAI